MFLLVGLGNPGSQYDRTRHNVGFMLADLIASEAGTSLSQNRFHSHTARANWEGFDLFLMKPQTFMNVSGRAVQEAMAFFKVPPERLVVLCDDLDQEPGAVRTRFGGGHGGHNGLRDILATLGSEAFHRIKIGIGKPEHRSATAQWVLSRFSTHEELELEQNSFKIAKQRLKDILKRS